MGILADSGLILQAQPSLFGKVELFVTEGRNWQHKFVGWKDASGAALEMASLTGVCEVFDALGEVVATITVTGDDGPTVNGIAGGACTLSLDDASTGGLAGDVLKRTLRCGFYLTDGDDSIQVWGPSESTITIESED